MHGAEKLWVCVYIGFRVDLGPGVGFRFFEIGKVYCAAGAGVRSECNSSLHRQAEHAF